MIKLLSLNGNKDIPLTEIIQADPEQTRILHEAFQYLTLKKKKRSGRSMVQNWGKVGGKAMLLNAGKLGEVTEEKISK